MSDPIRGQTAICGLGITEMGKVYGHDASWFAGESIRLASKTPACKRTTSTACSSTPESPG